jgi:hypothetical protein
MSWRSIALRFTEWWDQELVYEDLKWGSWFLIPKANLFGFRAVRGKGVVSCVNHKASTRRGQSSECVPSESGEKT